VVTGALTGGLVEGAGALLKGVGSKVLSRVAEGGTCSFIPTTQVTTNHGKQAIGKLQVGNEVLAYNPRTHKMELQPILHVWIHADNDLIDITIATISHSPSHKVQLSRGELLHTTSEHPFLTLEKGFLPAGHLSIGMHILRADGGVGIITGWKMVPGTMVMYNLEVAHDHTFTVGDGQWVVHNSCLVNFQSFLSDTRSQLGMSTRRVVPRPDDEETLAVLFADGEQFIGTSGGYGRKLNNIRGLNNVAPFHAEVDTLSQLVDLRQTTGTTGGTGFLFTDRPPCTFCSPGTLRVAARAAGLDELFVYYGAGYDLAGNFIDEGVWHIIP